MTHAHHGRLHDRITRRLETRTWVEPGRRARITRQAAWALADHLRCCHGARRVNNRAMRDLVDLHSRLHRAGAESSTLSAE